MKPVSEMTYKEIKGEIEEKDKWIFHVDATYPRGGDKPARYIPIFTFTVGKGKRTILDAAREALAWVRAKEEKA